MVPTIHKLILLNKENCEVEAREDNTFIRKSSKIVLTLLVTGFKIIVAAGTLFIILNSLLTYFAYHEPELHEDTTTGYLVEAYVV